MTGQATSPNSGNASVTGPRVRIDTKEILKHGDGAGNGRPGTNSGPSGSTPNAGEKSMDAYFRDLTARLKASHEKPDGLSDLASGAGLTNIDCVPIEVPTVFRDFEDYWLPFTLGAGPAPGYCVSLTPEARQRLKERLQDSLPRQADGSIPLKARAWALKALVG